MWSITLFSLVMVMQVMCNDTTIQDTNPKTRISQGHPALEGQIPYQAFIEYKEGDKEYSCGGSIISKKYILTAAHCLDDEIIEDLSKLTVSVGSIYRSNGTEIQISKAIRYPNFSNETYDNDVAILTAEHDIEFTDNIMAIPLPPKNRLVLGSVWVSGWGKTQEGNPLRPSKLMYVELPLVDPRTCQSSYPLKRITENMWCAGHYHWGGPAACEGDSGGPAMQDNLLVGVVSWGWKCGAPRYPTVFVNVASTSIRDFITEHTGL